MSTIRDTQTNLPPVPREVVKRKHVTDKDPSTGKENFGRISGVKKPRVDRYPGTPVKPSRSTNTEVNAIQAQIEREYKIRDGAARLLQASKSSTWQSMEASKGLFVSNAKIIALMKELQQKQAQIGLKKTSGELRPCHAKIAISEIRIPLEWREFEYAKSKPDSHTRYGVFCLFKMGNQVMDTPTLVEVDRTTMDIIFRDTIIFADRVDPDFNLEVEVYCSAPSDDSSGKPSTPIKMFKKFITKDKGDESPAPSHTYPVPSSPYAPHNPTVSPSHRFVLAGYASLSIKDISISCRTYPLKRGSVGASGTASTGGKEELFLPLWGQICCKLMAQPDCATEPRLTGFINLQRMVGGLPDWKRLWCIVRQHHLRCWASPEDVGKKMPLHHIELTKKMTVETAPRLSMRRPNTLLLRDGKTEMFIAFECKEKKTQWMNTINQGILDLKVWQSSSEFVIPIPHSKFYAESPTRVQWDTVIPSKSGGEQSETLL